MMDVIDMASELSKGYTHQFKDIISWKNVDIIVDIIEEEMKGDKK